MLSAWPSSFFFFIDTPHRQAVNATNIQSFEIFVLSDVLLGGRVGTGVKRLSISCSAGPFCAHKSGFTQARPFEVDLCRMLHFLKRQLLRPCVAILRTVVVVRVLVTLRSPRKREIETQSRGAVRRADWLSFGSLIAPVTPDARLM